MEEKSFPLLIFVYKGEGRLLIVPVIEHMYGYSIVSDKFYRLDEEADASQLGDIIEGASDYIKNCPLSTLTPKEREANAAWKKNTKYKSEISFWKNNHFAEIKIEKDGSYEIFSKMKSEKVKGSYKGIIKKLNLSKNATPDEIGKAVLDVLHASEEYYDGFKSAICEKIKEIQLIDTTEISFKVPSHFKWEDCADSGAAEIYQCYRYTTNDDEFAALYLGMASELDCDLAQQNIYKVWTEMYGPLDYFDVQNIQFGIFELRVEIKNISVHKISYFRKMSDDLLLESSMELHNPNKRKKLDENLTKEFEEFTASCKSEQL